MSIFSLNSFSVDKTVYDNIPDMQWPRDFTIYQPRKNQRFASERRHKRWHCKKCGHLWLGIQRIWRENRKPSHCPKCNAESNRIEKVKK